jgi:glycosyltransferase involved in cell wall biosynthesis
LTVLHAIPSFVGGGAERQLSLLAPELCRLGVQTHIAYVHPGVNLAPLVTSKVRLHAIACGGNHDPRILLKLVDLIRYVQPDLVQTWLTQMDIFAGVAARLTGTPFVLSERSSAPAYSHGWKNRLRWRVGQLATAVVANSKAGADYWRPRCASRVIRNGLPLSSIRAATAASPESMELQADTRVILFAGRLSPEKNIEQLLQALDQVLDRHPDCAAVLFGDGPLRAPLDHRVSAMRARARVRLAGFTPELWRWMRRASVFVSVSHFEGNPNTVLEAMAIGCPLVVSDIPQHREILDGTMTQFCNPASVDDIARAIDAVLDAPDLAGNRAAAALDAASASSIEQAANAYLSLYLELTPARVPAREAASP